MCIQVDILASNPPVWDKDTALILKPVLTRFLGTNLEARARHISVGVILVNGFELSAV